MTGQSPLRVDNSPHPPVARRAPRRWRWVLKILGYGSAAFSLAVVWFFHVAFVMMGGPYLSPVLVSGIAAGAGFLIVAAALLRQRNSITRLVALIAVFGAFLAVLTLVQPGGVRQLREFQAAYREIQLGMSVAEVRAVVDAHFPAGRMQVQIHPNVCFVGPLDPDDGAFNAEFFEVRLANGIVISKQYLPD